MKRKSIHQMVETSKSFNRFNAKHALVLLAGLLVFVLLILAKKTHLEGSKSSEINAEVPSTQAETPPATEEATDPQTLLALLPPAIANPSLDSLVDGLAQVQLPADRQVIYQALVDGHRNSGRLDMAAVYAGALADEQPDPKNLVVAGALFRNAVFLEHFQHDSTLFRTFSEQALRHLRKAESLQPENVDALLELGLAMIESRESGLGMEGVLKIRKVTELDPKNVEAFFRLGVFSMDTKQFENAEKRFRQVLDLDPSNISAQFLLAMACKELGKMDEYDRLLRAVAKQTQDVDLAAKAQSLLNQH